MKVFAEQPDILHAGLILSTLDVGDLALGHLHFPAQFRLIQFFFFPKESDFFAKCQFHIITNVNLS